ncbi:hypothetical protein MTBBW1_2710002 [Desulfamplus magnetovallimortis]|uniref:Uncharacterized protein n=1 Tax=Desulfamplus magnetovallimortis TaxID=1246637 RepID=A0A1W1HFG1_9BACT|nr:hypothetical protein [Desulfamplus magnetovallimortis]SLM31115.1 hypothetical protein MTBBW1_2710002 [Desulfamplus magnetovallimortis]
MAPSKSISEPPKYIQNDLFGKTLRAVYLFAPNSPKKAFYRLSLEIEFSQYIIRKQSGIGNKVLDHRKWIYKTLPEAEKSFNSRIRQKTCPDRKSQRHYIEIKS